MMRSCLMLVLLCIGRSATAATELDVEGARFTVNGKPTFLLGMSYYGALGASREFIQQDLDDMRKVRINWIRVFATWGAFGNDVSAIDQHGQLLQPHFDHLKWLIAECDRRGMIVDVTLALPRAGGEVLIVGPVTLDDYRRAAVLLATELKPFRNWYLDLANENNSLGHRERKNSFAFKDLNELRNAVKKVDPGRLVTVSYAGNDATEEDLRHFLREVNVDFVTPHRLRRSGSPEQTAEVTRNMLATMKRIGRVVPVHYQEPLRRGFRHEWWIPKAEDFVTDLRGAIAGGAAGWCFHNGDNRASDADDGEPRRSFDMRKRRLFEQFDEEERKVVQAFRGVMTR